MTRRQPLPPVVIRIGGQPHTYTRVPIDQLVAWRRRRGFTPAGRVGGPASWPPAILYERISHACAQPAD